MRICTNTHYNNTYSCEYALLLYVCTFFQIPMLVLAPENEHCFGSKHLTKWAGCWVYHFPIDANLLDHQYPVVIAYNGIHHYVSTYILDQKSRNSAILNLMKTMTQNISEISEGLAGRGATGVKMYFDQLVTELENSITSGDLAKLTAPSSLSSSAPPAGGSSSQAHPPAAVPAGQKKIQM